MRVRTLLLCVISLGLAACGQTAPVVTPTMPEIKPQDFALLPCGLQRADRPCALAVAGGKRVLFGAPAGVAATLAEEDLRQLDAVMLFSLRARDIEGLDEVRNESWQAGRDDPLLVVGPEGTSDIVNALNKAFEQADALRIVEEGIPPGGYDAAVLIAQAQVSSGIVFDTGDVRIDRTPDGFEIRYDPKGMAYLHGCGQGSEDDIGPESNSSSVLITCDASASERVWPLTEPLFIVKN